jgi:predicted nucleic acid-binding protein
MRIIDTNLIIYAMQPAYNWLLPIIKQPDSHYATITKIEVLGFKNITALEKTFFELLFANLQPLHLTQAIIDKAIEYRQNRKMSLGDAIIAATAHIHHFEIYTHNVKDFNTIHGLTVIDPIP